MKKININANTLLKLNDWKDMGNTEVTGFFISEPSDPLTIIDAKLIKATCNPIHVDIDPNDMLTFYRKMFEQGIYTNQLNIWWHTHPKMSPTPSCTDYETFDELNNDRNVGIMFILADDFNYHAEITVKDPISGISCSENLQMKIFSHPNTKHEDYETIKKEYEQNVIKEITHWKTKKITYDHQAYDYIYFNNYQDELSCDQLDRLNDFDDIDEDFSDSKEIFIP